MRPQPAPGTGPEERTARLDELALLTLKAIQKKAEVLRDRWDPGEEP